MIKLSNIRKTYKKNQKFSLNLDSFEIREGEFVNIIGRSGSGKSTLLNILSTIDTPDSGSYILNGREVLKLKGHEISLIRQQYFGMVFQSYHLINELTIVENIEMPLGYAGVSKDKRRIRARKLLEDFGLNGYENKYPSELSGGEKQRVAIARALINDPKIILADEPTGNLDEKNTEIVMSILSEVNKQGTTIIMVTHNLDLNRYCSRVFNINSL